MDRSQHLVPTAGRGDDGVWLDGPDERSQNLAMLDELAVDGDLEVDQQVEYAVLEPTVRQLREEAIYGVQPPRPSGCEMKCPAWVQGRPRQGLRVLVAGVVVAHDVYYLDRRNVAFGAVEEAQKTLVPVSLHALAAHRAVRDVERGEQGGGAVGDVVVAQRAGPTPLHWQLRLGAIHRLKLVGRRCGPTLVSREYRRMCRWGVVETSHIANLGGEQRVSAELEGVQPVRRQGGVTLSIARMIQ